MSTSAIASRRNLTTAEVSELLGVSPRKVIAWIDSGQLRAMNFAVDPRGLRPRYRITPKDLEAFEAARLTRRQPMIAQATVAEDRLLVDYIEAARLMSVSTKTIARMAHRGEIAKVKIGNRGIRIPVTSLQAWIAKQAGGEQ